MCQQTPKLRRCEDMHLAFPVPGTCGGISAVDAVRLMTEPDTTFVPPEGVQVNWNWLSVVLVLAYKHEPTTAGS